MKKVILFLLLFCSTVLLYGQTLGFEFGCVSGIQSKESPTGKIGMVYTSGNIVPLLAVFGSDAKLPILAVIGVNAPHERHPVLQEVSNRIHVGAYSKLGLGIPIIKDWLTIYPNLVYNTRYWNISKSDIFYKNDIYYSTALRFGDPKYNASFILSLDKRNVTIGATFNIGK